MRLKLREELRQNFEGLRADLLMLEGVKVLDRGEELEAYKEECFERLRGDFELEGLKDEARIRAYRDFFWRVGIDPTKIRPASEALLRRVLQGKSIPTINTLVDSYNLASMETRVALAAFDLTSLGGDLIMRFAEDGEEFLGIGMSSPVALRGKEIVVEDVAGLVAVYPYRDADRTKVSLETEDVVIMVCGVPGIDDVALAEAHERVSDLITRFCGGRAYPPR
ncbi:MAG: B3/4 domain-containing protein [Thermoplasmata archaeon]